MALFDSLQQELEKEVVIYPYKDIDDEHWAETLDGEGNKIPAVPYEWRDVGFRVKRPDLAGIKFVEKKSTVLVHVPGMNVPHRDFDPNFIEYVVGYKGKKGLILDWVGVTTMKDGVEVPKPYDADWLYDKMRAGVFLYSNFMKKYNELIETVKTEEKEKRDNEENF